MSNDKYEEVVLDVDSNDLIYSVEDTEAETEEVEMFGVVTDCLKLNIREKPDKNSGIVTVVTCLTELKIVRPCPLVIGMLFALLPVLRVSA